MMGFSPCAVQLIFFSSPCVASVVLGYDVIMAGTGGRDHRGEEGEEERGGEEEATSLRWWMIVLIQISCGSLNFN